MFDDVVFYFIFLSLWLLGSPPPLPFGTNSISKDDVNGQNKIHESVKTCPKDDESLNVQNNWTPKHDNKDSANAEVNSLQNNMI